MRFVRFLRFGVMLGLASFCVTGCATVVKCEHAVKYSGYSVEITGVDLPLPGGQTFKLGKASIKPEKVQEARDLVQTLDLLQFSDCQSSLLVKSDDARERIASRRHKTFEVLSRLLSGLDSSSAPDKYEETLAEGKSEARKLAKTSVE